MEEYTLKEECMQISDKVKHEVHDGLYAQVCCKVKMDMLNRIISHIFYQESSPYQIWYRIWHQLDNHLQNKE
jgi:hypothetical protein